MLCIRPFRLRPGMEFGCGQCLPCRINKRRIWTARLVLEGMSYAGDSLFFTLTYDKAFLPAGGTLVPGHLEEFRYRLRYVIGAFRYYFIGEYGERRFRPHYHGVVFGWMPKDLYVDEEGRLRSHELDGLWEKGVHHVGTLSADSAMYSAGYVTKKLTNADDPRLRGRHQEFCRMSRRPGIGKPGLTGIINWLYSKEGALYVQRTHDVPQSIRINGKIYPLGRYLVGELRNEIGIASSDSLRSLRTEAMRLERLVPEVSVARELRREGSYQRAHWLVELNRSKEKI